MSPSPAPTPDASTTGKHIPALDGLRGLAVLLILGVHLFYIDSVSHNGAVRAAKLVFNSGWIGVDLFFTLSGFLITGILYDTLNDSSYFRDFYARRALRIFPLYYGFFLLSFLVSVPLGYHWDHGTWKYLTYTLSPFSGFPVASNAPWIFLGHFWTLAAEEQFYLVWPLVVWLCRTRRRIVAVATFLALFSISLRIALEITGVSAHHPAIAYEWTLTRLDGLLIGAILAIVVRSRMRATVLRFAPPVATVAVVALVAYAVKEGSLAWLDNPRIRTLGFTGFSLTAAALIAASLSQSNAYNRLFSVSPLRFLGKYSYGVYVLHLPVLRYLQVRVEPTLLTRMGAPAALISRGCLAFVITLALAMLSYRFFEMPILSLKSHFQGHRPARKFRHLDSPLPATV